LKASQRLAFNMSEHDNDGFYWEPTPEDDLRQGDLLFNVPTALMQQRPRFVLGEGDAVETQVFDEYPENAPSDLIVVEARFGVLSIRLRNALARFWARGDASDSIERSMRPQMEQRPLEDLE
jgi:hypothetical protein